VAQLTTPLRAVFPQLIVPDAPLPDALPDDMPVNRMTWPDTDAVLTYCQELEQLVSATSTMLMRRSLRSLP
jgi:hypothetical protein